LPNWPPAKWFKGAAVSVLLICLAALAVAPPALAQRLDTLYVPYEEGLAAIVDSLEGQRRSLPDLVAVAVRGNLGARSSLLATGAAAAGLRAARGAFRPLLNASGAYDLSNAANDVRSQQYSVGVQKQFARGTAVSLDLQTTRSTVDLPAGDRTGYGTGLSLGLVQPLLEGYGLADEPVKRAKNTHAASRDRHRRSLEEVVAQIERAYWALGEAEALEAVFIQSLKTAEVLLYRNTELNKRGLATNLDVLTAESGFELRRSNLIDARRARRDAAEALVYVVYGERATEHLQENDLPLKTVSHGIAIPASQSFSAVEAAALEQRFDLRASRRDLQNSALTLRRLKSALRPNLDLQGLASTNGTRTGFGKAFGELGSDMSWSVSLVLSQFMGNDVDRGSYIAARRQQEQRELALAESENGVRRQVREAGRALESGMERLKSAARAADLAHRQLEAEKKRLDLGLGDSFRVLQTEENTAGAALAEVRARIGLAQAVTAYRLAAGRIGAKYSLEEFIP
jgi:outer membrane protein